MNFRRDAPGQAIGLCHLLVARAALSGTFLYAVGLLNPSELGADHPLA